MSQRTDNGLHDQTSTVRKPSWPYLLWGLLTLSVPTLSNADEGPMEYIGLKERGIVDIALMPDGDVLAGTDQGVWRVSADGKSVTQMSADGMPRSVDKCSIRQIAADSSGNIFAAVGPGATAFDGLYRLKAGTGRWESVGQKQFFTGIKGEAIGFVSVFPDDTVFCAVLTKSIYSGESRAPRPYRSFDGGDTWEAVVIDNLGGVHLGPMIPGPGRQIWAIGGERPYWGAAKWFMVADDWKGTAGWKIKSIEPQVKPGAIPNEHAIGRLALDRQGVAYALVNQGKPPYPPGVYRSKDGGDSWQKTTDGQRMNALVVTPDDHVYFGSYGGIIHSQDGGTTWKTYAGLGKTFVSDLLIDRNGHLWASCDSFGELFPNYGLFRSKQSVGKGESPGGNRSDDLTSSVKGGTDQQAGTNKTGVMTKTPEKGKTGNKDDVTDSGKGSTGNVSEPAAVTKMTLQAGKRRVKQGDTVSIPIWLLKGQGVANLNFNINYDSSVVKASGAFAKGNLLEKALFEANPKEAGTFRVGFAQNTDLSGDGTVAQVTFQAIGAPGAVTPLTIEVTTISGMGGGKPSIDLIHGEILITGENGNIPGDSDGDGEISARDAGDALKMSVKLIPVKLICDIDKDGQVTSTDARLILAKASGK